LKIAYKGLRATATEWIALFYRISAVTEENPRRPSLLLLQPLTGGAE
jgi:hypothetical protein